MTDKREQIMSRLLAIAGEVEGVVEAGRNDIDRSESRQPAIVLLEGDEQANEDDPRSRPSHAPRRVTMTPQLVIMQKADVENVGTDLNAFRAALIKAVCTDAQLSALSMNGHNVQYLGMQSDFAFGRQMLGRMAVMFGITYALKPADL